MNEMSDFSYKCFITVSTTIISIIVVGIAYSAYEGHTYPSYKGDFMVSALNGDGTLENTIQTNKIMYDTKKKVWECTDKNNGEVYFFKDNILIEKVLIKS